jgi:hypothetical protein
MIATGPNPLWPSGLEGIHICHIPPSTGNQYGRLVIWGHGVDDEIFSEPIKSTQAYVWNTAWTSGIRFMDSAGLPSLAEVPNFKPMRRLLGGTT